MYSLASYLVSVSDRKTGKLLAIDSCISAGKGKQSLFSAFNQCLSSSNQPMDFPEDKKLVNFKTPSYSSSSDTLWGQVRSGEYGYTTEIYDPNTKSIAYKKTKNQAGMHPFHYYFMPSNKPQFGILVVERFKQFGIKSFLHQRLFTYLANNQQDVQISFEKVASSALINKLLTDGEVKTIRLVKYETPSDICDQLDKVDPQKNAQEIELVIKAKRKGFFSASAFLNAFQSNSLSGLITLPSYDYDDIKVDVDYDGKKRVVSLGHPERLSEYIDVSEELEFDTEGHPTVDSLKKAITELASEINKHM